MTVLYKVLGQVGPPATSLTNLYVVPLGRQAVASTLSVCNTGVSTTVRVAVCPAGAAIDPKHYIVFNATVNQYETLFFTLGLTLTATDVVKVYAGAATVAFNLFGSEVV